MGYFVHPSSIVRTIWGSTDVTLFIFAGAAAEFALNKEVDWLFFTGRLPADPIGRLFSTVSYAQRIIFQEEQKAVHAIGNINTIHEGVEANRGRQIPAEAYHDVLYMLIHYSIAAFELLERKLTEDQKNEMVLTFSRIGTEMHLLGIPTNYNDWKKKYNSHLDTNLLNSNYTSELFKQY
ncbi:MAG TPA: oxygenase MpaB family protein, partial [Flavitalea sp.]|nr:oxygenase MpaB family protein [Flavitalea sp.]